MTDQNRIDQLEKLLNSEDDAPVRITADGRVVPMEGPQPPTPFSPTMHLRWRTWATPGQSPDLQQLWVCDDKEAVERGQCSAEEWRDIGYVNRLGQSIV